MGTPASVEMRARQSNRSVARINRHNRASCMPLGNESRAFDKDRGTGPKRRERLFGLGDELPKPHPCPHPAEYTDHGRLASHGILAGRFTYQRGVAFEIEKIVGDLECLADCRPVAL